MNFFVTNPAIAREPSAVRSPTKTPSRKHFTSNNIMSGTTKSPSLKNIRSACTTSSTVLTYPSSPNSIVEVPRTPERSSISPDSYYKEQDENDECEAPGVCFGGWVLNRIISPSRLSRNDAFTPSPESVDLRHQSKIEGSDHPLSPTKLELALNTCEDLTDGLSCSSVSCHSLSSSSEAKHGESESILLESILSMASKSEKDCDFNAAVTHIENYLFESMNLSHQSTPGFEFRKNLRKASALHKLGCLQWQCGRYQLSLSALVEACTIYDRLIDDTGPSPLVLSKLTLASANVLVSLGRLHLSRGEGSAAMHCYRDCVQRLSPVQATCDRSQSARLFSQACVGAGRVLISQDKLSSASKRFKRALKVQLGYEMSFEEGHTLSLHSARVPLPDIAETFSHLGNLYVEQENLNQAKQCYTNSLQIYSISLGPNHVDTGNVSNKLGRIFQRLSRLPDAEQAFQRAHQIFLNNLGEYHRNTAAALLNLGMLYASQGKQKKAQTIYHRVLRCQQVTFNGEAHADLALTFHCIASSYEGSFKLDKAMKYYSEELRVLKATLHPYHLDIAKLLHHMAMVTMNIVDKEGNYLMLNESIDWLEEAFDVYKHHNALDAFQKELSYLQTSIRKLRKRRQYEK
eukprot:scaffold66328_cov66-Cyclotella_meneghiniana.AAC.2